MHPEARDFTLFVKQILNNFFIEKRVLDVGSGDINGNNLFLFENCEYDGNDVIQANNVTIVSKTKDLPFENNTFDTIVSTECFEHDPEYKESFVKIYNMLKPDGLFFFTCASTNRPEHGTKRMDPGCSYGTIGNLPDMSDYYKNLTEIDLNEALPLNNLFSVWDTYYNNKSNDLYFVGIKKGNYTFNSLEKYVNNHVVITSSNIGIMESQIGFIILRHVNSELTNKYWIKCVNSIRQYYPENKILIIDDNSNYEYITEENLKFGPERDKITIINSEYPKRGELLPYYYYLHNKLFDIAVIIHDSVFINKYIDMRVEKYRFIWDFTHEWDEIADETRMINVFNDLELTEFYKNKNLWTGCFGCMSIITHDYLTHINNKYDISKLIDYVLDRYNRSRFERVIACLLQKEGNQKTLLGSIHTYCKWGINFNQIDNYKHLPLIKCWTGR